MSKRIAVGQKNDHSLGVFSVADGSETARIALAPYPHEMALSPDRSFAYLAHFGVALAEDEGPGGASVSVVDLAEARLAASLSCFDWRRPHGIATDASGGLYVLSEATGRLLYSPAPLEQPLAPLGETGAAGSHIVTVTGDGRLAACSNMVSDDVSLLDCRDPERPVVRVPTGKRPEGSVFDVEESLLYVACRESAEIAVIDVAAGKALAPIATPPGPVRLCRGREGSLLVPLYHARALAVVAPRDCRVTAEIALPDQPVSVGYDAELDWAFCGTLGDQVVCVDLAAGKVARRIDTRAGPDPVVTIG